MRHLVPGAIGGGFVLLTALVCSGSGGAAEGPPGRGLTFSLAASKAEYVLYEPVILGLRLRNKSAEAVAIRGGLSLSQGDVELSITDPNGVRRRYNPGVFAEALGARIELEAGECDERSAIVSWNANSRGMAFPETGSYQLDAALHVSVAERYVRLDAGRVAITIKPQGAADAKFTARIGSRSDLVKLLVESPAGFCGGMSRVTCFEDLRGLAREIPDSAYAPFVLYYLAVNVAGDILAVTPNRYAAVELYKELLERWPAHDLRAAAYAGLGMALMEVGKRDPAAEYIKKLEAEFPCKAKSVREYLRASEKAGN